ncbi:uncharacterized protein N7511_002432 [Penicillium nucicola]|uniref:uncharacterized protein n=1 Tax=Penicillium nucicola TaxID=1850975 RepID=UPI00254535B5|nr:uncharacterized protein N7511_002432 [Penicillium nucicola]KAJ5770381.1 hypothetical protein N7511_002432 [Penicillium nucicola]
MCQIWHFELEMLLHLPFMLRAATDRRYEYSRISCLTAGRNLIKRWISICECHDTLLFSNLLEFQAFTAATTILLGLLGAKESTDQNILQERYEDTRLVETIVQNFERLQQHGAVMSVGTQSISVIHTLQRFLRGETQSDKMRLEIPFFGVIRIARGGAVQPLEGERIVGANACQNPSFLRPAESDVSSSRMGAEYTPSLNTHTRKRMFHETDANEGSHAGDSVETEDTILQISGGHFQFPEIPGIQDGLDASDWSFGEDDLVFFDSLVNTDLVGNWIL